MGNVIDLTEQPEHDILHRTESDGLFGGKFLSGEPLESYLEGDETAKFALRTKKSGLTIEGESERSFDPDSNYQLLALVTDLRLVFVAGQSGGDRSRELPLTEVVETAVDSGLRTSTLTIETLSNETWSVSSRGDLSAIATYIEEAAQIWANAGRLLDDLEDALGVAQDHLTNGAYTATREELDGAAETIETAERRIAEVGEAARAQIAERGDELREWLIDIRRELTAQEAAQAHARAQNHWQEGEYEAAATAYEQTLDSYGKALEIDGSVPSTELLQSRLQAAAAERELLRIGPIVDADTSRRRAGALADPEDAADEWETALERYRELLGLEWGASEQEFVADHDLIREQTAEIADDAIGDHHEAGRRWLHSGDKLAVQDRERQAEQVYKRARHQFEQAHQLASEVRPQRVSEIETAFEAADRRLDGGMPTSTVPDDPIGFEPATDEKTATEEETADPADEQDGIEGLSFHDSGIPTHSTDSGVDPATESVSSGPRSADSSPSVLDKIQAQKQASVRRSSEHSASNVAPPEPDSQEKSPADTDSENSAETELATAQSSDEQLEQLVGNLDAAGFTELVADLWEAEGWMTTVFEDAGETVYDVVAMRDDTDERLLIWTNHTEGEANKTVIKQCATTLESSHGSNGAVLVTADSLTKAARRKAETLDVRVVERDELIARLEKAVDDGKLTGAYFESPQA